jgi:hypothetical protein
MADVAATIQGHAAIDDAELQTVMQAVQFARVREIGIVESLNPIVST